MDVVTRELIKRRAGFRCEYCRLSQRFSEFAHHIEHIVAKQHGGSDDPDNLALACHRCNLHKGPNLTGIDPRSAQVVTLFHPRRELWSDHFEFDREWVVGLTATGRATVQVLAINDPRRRQLRREILKYENLGSVD
jgi:hypothetical protein